MNESRTCPGCHIHKPAKEYRSIGASRCKACERKKPDGPVQTRFAISLNKDYRAKLSRLAVRRGAAMAAVVQNLIDEALGEE